MCRPALLLLAVALACGRKLDPTVASAPTDSLVYLRVRSWEELLSAAPFLRMMLSSRGGEQGPLPGDSGLERDSFDDRRPFGVGLLRDGIALVLPRSPSAPDPSPAGTWGAEPLPGDALGVWRGEKPKFGGLGEGELLEGLLSARVFLPKFAEGSERELGQVASSVAVAKTFLGLPAEATPGEALRVWQAAIRSLGTLDLGLEAAGGRFEVRARLRPSPASGVGRFASEARAAPHTLAGFLSKDGTILYLESSVDAATRASFFPRGFLGAGPVPYVLPGALGPLGEELAAHVDGREVLSVGHEEKDLFVESLSGLRDGAAYAALLASDRFAEGIENAVASLPLVESSVCERKAFRHGEVDVHRLRSSLRESAWKGMDSLRGALDRFGTCCFAVAGDLLVAVDGADAETRIRALLDRVRSGRLDRPPLAATLGSSRGRFAGIAADLGEGRRAFLGDRVPAGFGGKISVTLEASGGALEVAGTVEVRTPLINGLPGMPR